MNTTAEVYETTERMCDDECIGEECPIHNIFVTITGTKQPDDPYALVANEATTVEFECAVSFILVSGSEEATYVIELVNAEGDTIAELSANGTEYVNVCDYADLISSVKITASESATAYFYTLV